MIKFFRKIRQNLLSEGKTGKYFKYAIGEIILVVIGILIALQINNKNQQRIAYNEEKILLKILKDDFSSRLNELEFLNIGRQNAVGAIEQLMSLANNPPEYYNDNIMDSLLAISTTTYRFNEKFATMDMLFNSGKINSLSNDSLKYFLSNWPSNVEEMLEEQRLIVTNFYELEKTISKYVSLRDIYQKFSWSNYDIPNIEPSAIKKDYKGLLDDITYKNQIASKRFLLIINITDANLLIDEAKKIIELLGDEVNE
ncbi:DUF6090 family protein [Seonamhaeicola maritimus]|uniref:Uncharacterized protein n=1 Tax=Seonamhaeicola maritimus TaxID=2591822 RepID=A0A5C7GFD0_9FLAO|nr:DUF6090 family protein [Seonamhaeicola maritimus]TXG35772.1 hypothetical protein FUA22_14855 [Seonamhaeicola maritimus]